MLREGLRQHVHHPGPRQKIERERETACDAYSGVYFDFGLQVRNAALEPNIILGNAAITSCERASRRAALSFQCETYWATLGTGVRS